MIRGVRGMLGKTLRAEKDLPREKAIVLGTRASIQAVVPGFGARSPLGEEGFWLTTENLRGFPCFIVTATTDRGVLYGVFALLSKMARDESISALNEVQQPYAPLRWVDQWDNLDGGIERGYAGRSIFFEGGKVRPDLTRVREYARLLASLGINGCAINNVNANPHLLEEDFLPQIARIADAFREWGIRIAISIDFSSPKVIGGLDTFRGDRVELAGLVSENVLSVEAEVDYSSGRGGLCTFVDGDSRFVNSSRNVGGAVFFGIIAQYHQLREIAGRGLQSAGPIVLCTSCLTLLGETARQIHVRHHRIERKLLVFD